MDAENVRKVAHRVSIRSMTLALMGLAVLVVSVAWGVRQSRLTQQALDRAASAERAATQAQSQAENAGPTRPLRGTARRLRDEALQRAAHRNPREEAGRIRQLYAEIDSLMHVEEEIQQDLRDLRRQLPGPEAAAAPGATPPAPGPR